jgi:hypothetical protein
MGVGVLGQSLESGARLPARSEHFHDVHALAREPVLSSNVLGGFFGLDAFDEGLLEFVDAQLRQFAPSPPDLDMSFSPGMQLIVEFMFPFCSIFVK